MSNKKSLSEQVREFMLANGQELPVKPTIPTRELLQFRLLLIAEEFDELLESCYDGEIDMVAAADALADLDYVIEGMRLSLGIDGGPIADEVHRSNMAKVGAPKDSRGKVMKPVGWTPPDVEGELRKQGL